MSLHPSSNPLRDSIETATQLAADMEAQATRLRFDPTAILQEDLRPFVSPALLTLEATRMLLGAALLLPGAEPSDREVWARTESQVTEALGRVVALDTLWRTMTEEGI